MNRLRSIWAMRGVVTLLLASLLPVGFATALQAAQQTSSYADWLRSQMRGPLDGEVEKALAEAEESRARSLDAFLTSFVEAYEARHPETPLAQRMLALDLSNEALVVYLEGRFNGLVGSAVLPRTAFVAAPTGTSHTSDRFSLLLAAQVQDDRFYGRHVVSLLHHARPVFVWSVRLLWAAQPLGP